MVTCRIKRGPTSFSEEHKTSKTKHSKYQKEPNTRLYQSKRSQNSYVDRSGCLLKKVFFGVMQENPPRKSCLNTPITVTRTTKIKATQKTTPRKQAPRSRTTTTQKRTSTQQPTKHECTKTNTLVNTQQKGLSKRLEMEALATPKEGTCPF